MSLRATSKTETSVYNSLPMLLLLLALYIIVMWRCFKMPLNVPGIYLLLAMKYFLLLLIRHWLLLISFFLLSTFAHFASFFPFCSYDCIILPSLQCPLTVLSELHFSLFSQNYFPSTHYVWGMLSCDALQ